MLVFRGFLYRGRQRDVLKARRCRGCDAGPDQRQTFKGFGGQSIRRNEHGKAGLSHASQERSEIESCNGKLELYQRTDLVSRKRGKSVGGGHGQAYRIRHLT